MKNDIFFTMSLVYCIHYYPWSNGIKHYTNKNLLFEDILLDIYFCNFFHKNVSSAGSVLPCQWRGEAGAGGGSELK